MSDKLNADITVEIEVKTTAKVKIRERSNSSRPWDWYVVADHGMLGERESSTYFSTIEEAISNAQQALSR